MSVSGLGQQSRLGVKAVLCHECRKNKALQADRETRTPQWVGGEGQNHQTSRILSKTMQQQDGASVPLAINSTLGTPSQNNVFNAGNKTEHLEENKLN